LPSLLAASLVLAVAAAVAMGPGAGPARADSAELHNTTGLTYYYQGKDAEAFAEFIRALEKDPSYAQPHFNLGRLFERQKRYDEALRQYRDALQLDGSLVAAKEGIERLQNALTAQGRPSPVLALPPGGLSASALNEQLEAIRSLVVRGEVAEARNRLEALERLVPANTDVLLLLADLAEKRLDFSRAVELLIRVKTLLPGTPDVSYRLAATYLAMGALDKALAEVERAIQLRPTHAEYYGLMGRIQERMGKPSEAFNAFNEAGRLNPSDIASRRRADKLSTDLGLYYYNAGLFYFQQKSWVKAKEALRRAIDRGNLNPEQMAIAQQYLVVAEFSSARVADEIRKIQEERAFVEKGQVQKRALVPEVEGKPASFPVGRYVDFLGWIVARKDNADTSELIVTKNFREVEVRERRIRDGEDSDGGFRSNARMTEWYVITTPRLLPEDPRIAPSSRVRVRGRLGSSQFIRSPYTFTYSLSPQPTVEADYLEIHRERRNTFGFEEFDTGNRSVIGEIERRVDRVQPRPVINTPPGLSGPLKIDYLRYNAEQLKNLEPAGEL
jgi:tetratricopeptide (TPR) repeat protein